MKKTIEGYCRICGEHRLLTDDHIPPKACGNTMPVELHMNLKNTYKQNGLNTRTICSECNNERLGAIYDKDLLKLYNSILPILKLGSRLNAKYSITELNTQNLIKSLLGHILAAKFMDENDLLEMVSKPLSDEGVFTNYRNYFLGDNQSLDRFDIYYWYYPHETIKIYPYYAFVPDYFGEGNFPIYGTMIKFFPIALFILNKDTSLSKFTFMKLESKCNENSIKLNIKDDIEKDWPEIPKDKGIVLLDSKSMVSADKRKKS